MLHIRSLDIIHHRTKILYAFANLSLFPPYPLATTNLLFEGNHEADMALVKMSLISLL